LTIFCDAPVVAISHHSGPQITPADGKGKAARRDSEPPLCRLKVQSFLIIILGEKVRRAYGTLPTMSEIAI
jgi:hypothetical protein